MEVLTVEVAVTEHSGERTSEPDVEADEGQVEPGSADESSDGWPATTIQ